MKQLALPPSSLLAQCDSSRMKQLALPLSSLLAQCDSSRMKQLAWSDFMNVKWSLLYKVDFDV